jgi:hypothetical protein
MTGTLTKGRSEGRVGANVLPPHCHSKLSFAVVNEASSRMFGAVPVIHSHLPPSVATELANSVKLGPTSFHLDNLTPRLHREGGTFVVVDNILNPVENPPRF